MLFVLCVVVDFLLVAGFSAIAVVADYFLVGFLVVVAVGFLVDVFVPVVVLGFPPFVVVVFVAFVSMSHDTATRWRREDELLRRLCRK